MEILSGEIPKENFWNVSKPRLALKQQFVQKYLALELDVLYQSLMGNYPPPVRGKKCEDIV